MEWKDVVGWEGVYQVSRCGQVKSLARRIIRSNGRPTNIKERILKQNNNSNDYPCITMHRPGEKITLPVYILVANAFLGKTPSGLEILHGPKGKQVSDVSNLSFGTHQQNSLDMLRDGLASCKPVKVGEQVFRSIGEAAKHLKAHPANLSKSLHNGWKCRGFTVSFESETK